MEAVYNVLKEVEGAGMKQNEMKIVANASSNALIYYLKNERGTWMRILSKDSRLARKEYVHTSIREKAQEILQEILQTYNAGNRGIVLEFVGPEEEFQALQAVVGNCFKEAPIECRYSGKESIKVVVAGKIGVGKTTLIEALCEQFGGGFEKKEEAGYNVYKAMDDTIIWYELPGISLDTDIAEVKESLAKFAEEQVTLVYCLRSERVDEVESELLAWFKEKNPVATSFAVLTCCAEDVSEKHIGQISELLYDIKVFPVLAKEYRTRVGVLHAYGLEEVREYIVGRN